MIRPTHTCFDDAIEFLDALAQVGTSEEEITAYAVVHAICVTPAGEQFVHAWLERAELVWQLGILNDEKVPYAVRREEFYEGFRPKKLTRYTARQAAFENVRTGKTGPWLPEYEALCRSGNPRELGEWNMQVYLPRAPDE